MALRSIRGVACLSNTFRKYSTSGTLIDVSLNEKTGITTATLNSPPVNTLNLELLSELHQLLQNLEEDKSRGLIITSSSKSVFSAGLDILEMFKPKPDRLTKFWTTLQDTWISLYGSSFPTVAVINGHAPAGGCLMSLSCEYRIMLNNFTIGLNETKLGMIAPAWFAASMKNTLSLRETEYALLTGKLYSTEEALKVGLVDETAASKDEALEKAQNYLNKFTKIPPHARRLTKQMLRGPDIQRLVKSKEQDLQTFEATVANPVVQKSIEIYLESLKKKKSN